jgi:hypothetical protein
MTVLGRAPAGASLLLEPGLASRANEQGGEQTNTPYRGVFVFVRPNAPNNVRTCLEMFALFANMRQGARTDLARIPAQQTPGPLDFSAPAEPPTKFARHKPLAIGATADAIRSLPAAPPGCST